MTQMSQFNKNMWLKCPNPIKIYDLSVLILKLNDILYNLAHSYQSNIIDLHSGILDVCVQMNNLATTKKKHLIMYSN